MNIPTKNKPTHTPRHIYLDNTSYFITASIYQKRKLLTPPQLKENLLCFIQTCFAKFNWQLHHWVILDDHYHLLTQSHKGHDLPRLMRQIHSLSAKSIRENNMVSLPIWCNYWDYCLRSPDDYFTHLNYLLYNPIKHGYTTNLKEYVFSSFNHLYQEVGHEKLKTQFRDYPKYRSLVFAEDD